MDFSSPEIQLIAEHYDIHPQAIMWMQPVFAENNIEIIDFEYTYSNGEGLKFLNLSLEQFKGLLVSQSPTLSNNLSKAILDELIQVFTTGKKSETTVYNPVLKKHARVLRSKLRSGVLTVIQDVTKENEIITQLQKQACELEEQKRQLQIQKTLLDNILNNSTNGISVSEVYRDVTGKVIDALTILANDAAVKYIGLPKEIYLTKKATEIEPAVMNSPYYQACIQTLETGDPFVMQYQMQSTGRWLELTVSKMDYNHLIQVFTDVTPIKEAQLKLRKAAKSLKIVFDSAQTGMFTASPVYDNNNNIIDFMFVMVNSTISTYVKQPVKAIEGELVSKFFPGYFKNGVFEMYKGTFETGKLQRKEVHYNVEGFDNYLDLQSAKLDEDILVTTTDHTSFRESQIKLEQTIKALERSNTYLQEFAFVASHDLQEPLRKVLVFTNCLAATIKPHITESEIRLLDKIDHSAKQMQQLIEDLLELSHMNEQGLAFEEVDLNKKVQMVIIDLERMIAEKGAQIIIEDELPTVQGNTRQLQQMFQNLISNALKYSKSNEPLIINISARVINRKVNLPANTVSFGHETFHLIKLTDNGIGFEQKYSQKIFEMFKRLHGKNEYSGTGMGLSIVRRIVENHNGYIWAEGQPGIGATFYILLPIINK